MSAEPKPALLWFPRAVCIAFILFVSMFALDSFGEGRPLWQSLAAFAIHLIPSYVLIAMLVLAWRREWIGTVVSVALAALFLWWNATSRRNTLGVALVLAGPLFVMAALYLAAWLRRPVHGRG